MFEGNGYEKTMMEEGTILWTDRQLVLFKESYPKEFDGYELMVTTSVAKGEVNRGGKITAKEDGRIYFLAKIDKHTRKLWYRGWKMIVPSEVVVRRVVGETESGDRKYKEIGGLYIHYKDVKKGEVFKLHTTDSWTGVIPMASDIEYVD